MRFPELDRIVRCARAAVWLVLATFVATATVAQRVDLRSLELVELDCSSGIGSRQLTVFANGTTRVRLRKGEERQMLLKELGPGELDAYLNRLREVDLSEAEDGQESATGEWVESCDLTLDLDAGAFEDTEAAPVRSYSLGPYDSLSLSLSRVLGVVEEIFAWAQDTVTVGDFPNDYRPSPGEVLRRHDGLLFEVIAYTSDERGVELWGVDQPLVVYVLVEEIVGEFVEIVESN